MINAIAFIVAIAADGSHTDLSKSYVAKGIFYDEFGYKWDLEEQWRKRAYYKLTIGRGNAVVGQVSGNISDCSCSVQIVNQSSVGWCDLGSVLANSPIRQAIARALAGYFETKLADMGFAKLVARVVKTQSGINIDHVVEYPAGIHSQLAVQVKSAKNAADLPQPSRMTQTRNEHTYFGMWLEKNYFSLGTVPGCGTGALPGAIFASTTGGDIQIVEALECAAAYSEGDALVFPVNISKAEVCGSRGSKLNVLGTTQKGQATVFLTRDVAHKKIIFPQGLATWPKVTP